MLTTRILLAALAWATLVVGEDAARQRVTEHPLISRFPGSEVLSADVRDFDEYPLIVGPYVNGRFEKLRLLEGKVARFKYSNPSGRSSLEIFRSYEAALRRSGFETLFTCSGSTCGSDGETNEQAQNVGRWCVNALYCNPEPMRYLAARLATSGTEVYVVVKVMTSAPNLVDVFSGTHVNVIELTPMEDGLITVRAEALIEEIGRTGAARLYGIHFDSGKAEIRPESEPTIREVARLLRSNPALMLHVIGHTDNQGSLASNIELSRQRADAVVAALTTAHGIPAGRLLAAGVGPLAPVATNRTEEGRARNRRVELVER